MKSSYRTLRIDGSEYGITFNAPFVYRAQPLRGRVRAIEKAIDEFGVNGVNCGVLVGDENIWFGRGVIFSAFTEEVINQFFIPQFPESPLNEQSIDLFIVFDQTIVLCRMFGAQSERTETLIEKDDVEVIQGALLAAERTNRKVLVLTTGVNAAPYLLMKEAKGGAIQNLRTPEQLTAFEIKPARSELLKARTFDPPLWLWMRRSLAGVSGVCALGVVAWVLSSFVLMGLGGDDQYKLPELERSSQNVVDITPTAQTFLEESPDVIVAEPQRRSSTRWDTVAFAEIVDTDVFRFHGVDRIDWTRTPEGVIHLTFKPAADAEPHLWHLFARYLQAWENRQTFEVLPIQTVALGQQSRFPTIEELFTKVTNFNETRKEVALMLGIGDKGGAKSEAPPVVVHTLPVYPHQLVGGFDKRPSNNDELEFMAFCRAMGGEVSTYDDPTSESTSKFYQCNPNDFVSSLWQRNTKLLPQGRLHVASCHLPPDQFSLPTNCELHYAL